MLKKTFREHTTCRAAAIGGSAIPFLMADVPAWSAPISARPAGTTQV
jgi:hypothetical protein